jgi:Flp pilus assembly protein TadG
MVALTLRRRARSSRGAELVELALVLPLLLMLVAGIVDFAFMFQAFEVITNAAREGARIRVLPGYTTADAQARVASYVSAAGLTTVTPTTTVTAVTLANGGGGAPTSTAYQVDVTYVYSFRLLSPLLSNVTLRARSVMRSEL